MPSGAPRRTASENAQPQGNRQLWPLGLNASSYGTDERSRIQVVARDRVCSWAKISYLSPATACAPKFPCCRTRDPLAIRPLAVLPSGCMPFELADVEMMIDAAQPEQLLVRSLFDDAPVIDDDDQIGIADGARVHG